MRAWKKNKNLRQRRTFFCIYMTRRDGLCSLFLHLCNEIRYVDVASIMNVSDQLHLLRVCICFPMKMTMLTPTTLCFLYQMRWTISCFIWNDMSYVFFLVFFCSFLRIPLFRIWADMACFCPSNEMFSSQMRWYGLLFPIRWERRRGLFVRYCFLSNEMIWVIFSYQIAR